jgi:AcrR family transcriptional regulator
MRVTDVRSDVTAKWESRYREVLDAAAIAFAESGYLGASTRDIAERLGIRAASLYYYLPSNEAALVAICKLGVLDFINNLKDIIARRDSCTRETTSSDHQPPSAAAQPSCR